MEKCVKLFSKQLLAGVLALTAFVSFAQDKTTETLTSKFESVLGWKVQSIADAPVDGLLQLQTERGIFYASNDGTYLLQARIFNIDEGMRNETEAALTDVRKEGVKQFSDNVVEFKAEDEKYVVSVFTDITCGYCRRLHEQMDDYNDAGITVRYLAFPRAGLDSPTYQDMVSVWCSENPQEAMTLAKAGDDVATAKCANTIAEQYRFGQQVGVNGTPNIVLPNGTLIPGYQPAPALLQALQSAG
jgi:thiol:disulfide interchange protein DsbC